jgi:hypothetical protein
MPIVLLSESDCSSQLASPREASSEDSIKGLFFWELGRDLQPCNISSTTPTERFFARFRL